MSDTADRASATFADGVTSVDHRGPVNVVAKPNNQRTGNQHMTVAVTYPPQPAPAPHKMEQADGMRKKRTQRKKTRIRCLIGAIVVVVIITVVTVLAVFLPRLNEKSDTDSEQSSPPVFDPKWCASVDGIEYNGTCLWHEDIQSHLTVKDAVHGCQNISPSKLPEFYNKAQFHTLMDFMRRWIPGNQTYVFVWTSMQRDPETRKALLSDRTPAPYVSIRTLASEWSEATDAQTHVYLISNVDTAFVDRGMGARWPTYDLAEFHVSTLIRQGI